MSETPWWSFGQHKTAKTKTPSRNEGQDHEWASLEALWRRVAPGEADKFADLTKDPPDYRADGWNRFNFAEMLVGARLDSTQVAVEYQTLLRLANQRALPGVADFNSAAATVKDESPETPLAKKVEIYLSLLYALQSDFIESRFVRRLRREVADRLFGIGWVCVALTLIAPIGVLIACWLGKTAPAGCCSAFSDNAFVLTLVAVFGILGAFYSLANDFQAKVRTLNLEDVDALYKRRMILLRLLFGLVGAVIFYCIIRSQLVAGTVFPKLETLKLGDLFAGDREAVLALAKLLVWSFIAGFSERLVPQALTATEARSAQSTETKATAAADPK